MSKIRDFESRQEFERAFIPEWKRVELGETAKAFADLKRQTDQKLAGQRLRFPVGTDPKQPPLKRPASLRTVYRFG